MAEEKETPKEQPEEKKEESFREVPPGPEPAPLRGLVGTKIGMTRIFVDETRMVPATVISADGIVVSQVKTKETDGYAAVQVAYDDAAERKLSKAEAGHLSRKGVLLKRHLHEFRVDDSSPFKVGQTVPVSVFKKGEWLKASGLNKGKGFTGTVKRYGFKGGPHSHGHGEYRRAPGSSGGQGPQHVLPGTKKPGHKGHVWSTVPSIEVVAVDAEKNLILLGGSVPGPNGNFVALHPSRKKGLVKSAAKAGKSKGKK